MESRLNSAQIIERVGHDAKQLYGNGPLCCSEAVLTVINREFNGGLTQELAVALSKGFCGGIGDAGCICGALAGAVMAQSLILGKRPLPAEDEDVRKASKELHDRFLARYGTICCRDLSKDRDRNSESKGICLDYVQSAASMCAQLLLEPVTLPEAKASDQGEQPLQLSFAPAGSNSDTRPQAAEAGE